MKARLIITSISLIFMSGIALADNSPIDYYSAENIYKFADYLYQERDYLGSVGEYERYLLMTQDNNDTALYRLGLCYQRIGEIQKAIDAFTKLKDNYEGWVFPASYQIAYTYLISDQHKNLADYTNSAIQETQETDNASKLRILLTYGHLQQRQWTSALNLIEAIPQSDNEKINQLSYRFAKISEDGLNLKRKNRTLASILSMIIPGSGKMYCGQYGNGIYSFATVGATGLVAWRGFHSDGVSSIKGWIFGSLCVIFYSGNIYGSGISALAYNHQKENEILMRLPLLPSEW